MASKPDTAAPPAKTPPSAGADAPKDNGDAAAPEIGGRKGPEPTRYGDWEKDGRCVDF